MKTYLGIVVTALLAGASTQAAAASFVAEGTFVDGAQLSGTFDYDAADPFRFSNVVLRVSSLTSVIDRASLIVGTTSRTDTYLYSSISSDILVLSLANPGPYFNSPSFGRQDLLTTSSYTSGGTTIALRSGTVAEAGAAVPEPATWATMMLGFGVVGAAARRRRRQVA